MKFKKSDILHLDADGKVFRNASELKKEMTEAESILWEYLRNRRLNGLKFRKQHPILRFIADFYCHEARLIVEIDGDIHMYNKEYDEGRTYELNNYGISVLRFRNEEIKNDIRKVLDIINFEARNKASPLRPSPLGEGKNALE